MWLRTTLFLVAVLLASLSCGEPATQAPRTPASTPPTSAAPAASPNVLLYVVDTLRADALGAYGGTRARTPAVDRLAQEGVLFERAFAPASWTRPSMASLFTGTTPTYHGTETRAHHLSQELETLAESLGARGYSTAFVTANPNAASFFGFSQGFDEMIELFDRREPGRVEATELIANSAEVGARAARWLADAKRPFFLAILTVDPHFPYAPPAELIDGSEPLMDIDAAVEGPERPAPDVIRRVRGQYRRLYRAEVAFNDISFGSLIQPLRETGELDETIVVFTADHGEEFGEHGRFGHGFTLHKEVLHVPLVLRYPARVEPGSRVRRVVGTVDVVPTLMSLLGFPVPSAVRGRSLLEKREDGAEPVFASLDLAGIRLQSVRTRRWNLVLDPETGETRFYDLKKDPREVSAAAEGEGASERHRSGLERSLKEIAARRGGFDTAPPAGTGEVPEAVGEALEALGYAE